MVRKVSQIFVAGPPLVEKIGEKVTKEELGGSEVHGSNGVIDDVAENEAEAMEMAKSFLSFMPSSIHYLPKKEITKDDPLRKDDFLLKVIHYLPILLLQGKVDRISTNFSFETTLIKG